MEARTIGQIESALGPEAGELVHELIGLYLGSSAVGTSFGAAGSLALILLWVYYSAQILFFGAEFTQVYANAHGSRILPEAGGFRTDAPTLPASD